MNYGLSGLSVILTGDWGVYFCYVIVLLCGRGEFGTGPMHSLGGAAGVCRGDFGLVQVGAIVSFFSCISHPGAFSDLFLNLIWWFYKTLRHHVEELAKASVCPSSMSGDVGCVCLGGFILPGWLWGRSKGVREDLAGLGFLRIWRVAQYEHDSQVLFDVSFLLFGCTFLERFASSFIPVVLVPVHNGNLFVRGVLTWAVLGICGLYFRFASLLTAKYLASSIFFMLSFESLLVTFY